MGETKEVQLPKPLATFVLVANPLHGKEVEIRTKLEKMPEKNRLDYMKEHLYTPWQTLNALAVGPDVRGIKEGDTLITTPDMSSTGIHIMDGAFILIRESNFIGKW